MSRIYFTSPSGEAELLGAERAYLGHYLTSQLAVGLLNARHRAKELNRFVSPDHYMAKLDPKSPRWGTDYELAFSVGMGDSGLITWCGHEIDSFIVSLNTALAVGNDQIKLAARLHGQCEIHAWVEGEDRQWLATIINRGLEMGLYREGMGWEAIVEFLEDRNDEPVVTSYSVCDLFPDRVTIIEDDPDVLDHRPDDESDGDWYYECTKEKRWEWGMAYLRANGPQLSSRRWDYPDYHFQEGVTVFDLLASDYGSRLRALYDAAGYAGGTEETTEKETTDA